jgi:Tfp pilus assembly protein PilN
MPRVNLMPPEIAEAERFRRLQLAMGGAVVVSAALVAMLYQHAKSGISSAQSQLDAAKTQQTSLQTKLGSLSQVSTVFADVQTKQNLLHDAMGSEIRWSYMLNDLLLRIPSNVWLTSIQANETVAGIGQATTTTTVPSLGTDAGIGSVTFNGVAFRHDDVAAWLDALAKEKGFSDPNFSNSTETAIGTRGVVAFGSSVGLNPDALSNRYVPKAGS